MALAAVFMGLLTGTAVAAAAFPAAAVAVPALSPSTAAPVFPVTVSAPFLFLAITAHLFFLAPLVISSAPLLVLEQNVMGMCVESRLGMFADRFYISP